MGRRGDGETGGNSSDQLLSVKDKKATLGCSPQVRHFPLIKRQEGIKFLFVVQANKFRPHDIYSVLREELM